MNYSTFLNYIHYMHQLRCIALRCIALHHITSHHITSNYIHTKITYVNYIGRKHTQNTNVEYIIRRMHTWSTYVPTYLHIYVSTYLHIYIPTPIHAMHYVCL